MSNFFIRRPIVAMVISIIIVIVGLVAMAGCRSRNSRISFLRKFRFHDLCRRRRADGGGRGGYSDRATNERC